jgi:Flp pilus assembly pilin Flp
MREWRRFLKDESGSELVEWIALTLILLLATAAVLNDIGGQLKRIFKNILGQLESVPEG